MLDELVEFGSLSGIFIEHQLNEGYTGVRDEFEILDWENRGVSKNRFLYLWVSLSLEGINT